jgi:cytochrome c oxidase subunit III
MSTHSETHDSSKYYVPSSSYFPILGSVALFTLMLGAISLLNEWIPTGWALLPGALLIFIMFFVWFRTVIDENQRGIYNLDVDRSFRMGMMWFITSEVLFFAVFFGALFYARNLSVPWLSGEGVKIFNKLLIWKSYDAGWPTNGPGVIGGKTDGSFQTIPAFGLPAINTAILLTSGVTITIAHHALRAGKRAVLQWGLFATLALGFTFVYLQATEYH